MNNYLNQRFFGGSGDALECITNALQGATIIRIATAYFEPSGYQCLQDVIADKELFLLIGREQGGKDRLKDVINEFVDGLSMGSQSRRTRSMRRMLEALEQGRLAIGVGDDALNYVTLMDARYLYQHAKLYIADEKAVVVTSANMTEHGLMRSREAGRTLTENEDVSFFIYRFDQYFANAQMITEILIEKLRAWLEAYDPYIIYERALLELYGLPEEEVPPQLPPLADYQRPVVSRVLKNIEEYSGSMLIASTGLGKTVITAHTVAYLRMRGEIDNVIVVCPAGLREVWRKYMRASRTSSEEFSYHTLSGDDPAHNRHVSILEHELRQINEKTLIVLDESHHLRNDDDGTRLRNHRIEHAIRESGAKLLMMTATPFSKNIDDVNNQLELLPKPSIEQTTYLPLLVEADKWKVDNSQSLSELPPCFVLTTPTVVKYFSHEDENGDRFVFFSEDDRRYFPRRLRIHTVHYDNFLDDFLIELLNSGLLKQYRNYSKKQEETLFDLDEFTVAGKRNPLFESQILHQFCSSPAKVHDLCQSMAESKLEIEFARQDELTKFIHERLPIIKQAQKPEYDAKLQKLFGIFEDAGDQKIVIFCIYHETARSLMELIRSNFPNIAVETTASQKSDKVDEILRRFAPIANEVPDYERAEPVQLLIATGALAEGFNLQDAAILVNYDLPWTVLQLAQRMGRILRPWHEPREITIHNFIPQTMSNPQLGVALNWGKRLSSYSDEHRSFADIPVLLKRDSLSEDVEMVALARGLQYFDQVELDLDQVMDFIQESDQLQTTSFYDDLAIISSEEAEFIRSLPPGIRSARAVKGKKRLFVLFQYRKRYFPALFGKQGEILANNEKPDAIMKEIRCDRHEPIAPFTTYPEDDEFDQWIETAKQSWAEAKEVDPNKIQIICAMALVPQSYQ